MSRAAEATMVDDPRVEPVWQLAQLLGRQGFISEAEYLALDGNRRVEFSDGRLEVLPMPTIPHQFIMMFLYEALRAHLKPLGRGAVLVSGTRVRLRTGKFREPDVVVLLNEEEARVGEDFWEGADLVMEVVSPSNRRHDLEIKRDEYAEAGIPEYWIVDPQEREIVVLTLREGAYAEHGRFAPGDEATSVLLPGFRVGVEAVLAARV